MSLIGFGTDNQFFFVQIEKKLIPTLLGKIN